jgi:hypothetical protein
MEAQAVFDKVVEHLATQKVQSLSTGNEFCAAGNCAYRGANDTKCAFGIFIPDSSYRPEFEGKRTSMFFRAVEDQKKEGGYFIKRFVGGAEKKFEIPSELVQVLGDLMPHRVLILTLQFAHDGGNWPAALADVARAHTLKFDTHAFRARLEAK